MTEAKPTASTWAQGGGKARSEHLLAAQSKTPAPPKACGRPARHEKGAGRLNVLVAAEVARDLRVLALDAHEPVGRIVEAALRSALADPEFRARFLPTSEEVL